jgi:hypothetical protein
MKPCDGLTPDALRKWGEALNEEMPRSIGEALIQFADAWAIEQQEIERVQNEVMSDPDIHWVPKQQLAACEKERDQWRDAEDVTTGRLEECQHYAQQLREAMQDYFKQYPHMMKGYILDALNLPHDTGE